MGAGGKFKHILAHLRDLQARGPPRGYYPEPTKIILVVAPRNVAWAEELFRGMGIQVLPGHQYIGGFIGDREAEMRWLADNITGWADSVENLAGVSRKHPQCAYAGMQKSLQQGWSLVQQVTPEIGDAFFPAEKALRETFVTDVLEGLGEGAPERGVT